MAVVSQHAATYPALGWAAVLSWLSRMAKDLCMLQAQSGSSNCVSDVTFHQIIGGEAKKRNSKFSFVCFLQISLSRRLTFLVINFQVGHPAPTVKSYVRKQTNFSLQLSTSQILWQVAVSEEVLLLALGHLPLVLGDRLTSLWHGKE